jgi:hypothetical protein
MENSLVAGASYDEHLEKIKKALGLCPDVEYPIYTKYKERGTEILYKRMQNGSSDDTVYSIAFTHDEIEYSTQDCKENSTERTEPCTEAEWKAAMEKVIQHLNNQLK